MSLVKLAASLLVAAAIYQVAGNLGSEDTALAQSFGSNPESFPIPSSLPNSTTLRVDGSTSMRVTNAQLADRFEAQYPNIDVEVTASRTDQALQALINGEIDIVAAGRPLTGEENSQGLSEVFIEREKLAVILGPENSFDGNLTFEQFAQIFRGEITNWSEIGGPDLAIRLVDRPEYSDTRLSLSRYSVFNGAPFETGATADPISVDETDAVIAALGNDGIGYAVVSQVINREDVRILPMHQTLPDDPRYPYSQPRIFIYKEDASPATLAFLGFATTPPGQEIVTDTLEVPSDTVVSSSVGSDAVPGSESETSDATELDGSVPDATNPEATDSEAIEVPVSSSTETPDEVTTAQGAGAQPREAEDEGLPLWLLWLLGIPIAGGLLLWLLQEKDSSVTAQTPTAAPAPPIAPTAAPKANPRMVLTPRNSQEAYAYWEIPRDRFADAKRQGGEQLNVRLYDVTDCLPDAPLPAHTAQFTANEVDPDRHLPIEKANRQYLAEVGYTTTDDRWLPLAQSNPVIIAASPKQADIPPDEIPITVADELPESTDTEETSIESSPDLGLTKETAATAIGGLTAATALGTRRVDQDVESRIVLISRTEKYAYAYWEVSDAVKENAKNRGGRLYQLRLYDVTAIDLDTQPAHRMDSYPCGEADLDRHVPIPHVNRDYLAEIGYATADRDWIKLARSTRIRVASEYEIGAIAGDLGIAISAEGNKADDTDLQQVAEPEAAIVEAASTDDLESIITLSPLTPEEVHAVWKIPASAKASAKQAGGEQYQLRLYDVTAIDLDTQHAHRVDLYPCDEAEQNRRVPVPQVNRDYLAEIGYLTADDHWIRLARSTHIHVFAGYEAPAIADDFTAIKAPPSTTRQCAIETVKVHSRRNAQRLDAEQTHHFQNASASHNLIPGLHILRIRDGAFNYDGDTPHSGEPFVILWIHGGTVVNQKTGVPVDTTWSTLNGYADTLTLDVREPANLCAFFLDTFPEDNAGEITLSVIKL